MTTFAPSKLTLSGCSKVTLSAAAAQAAIGATGVAALGMGGVEANLFAFIAGWSFYLVLRAKSSAQANDLGLGFWHSVPTFFAIFMIGMMVSTMIAMLIPGFSAVMHPIIGAALIPVISRVALTVPNSHAACNLDAPILKPAA